MAFHISDTCLPISGIRLGTAAAGIKYPDRQDLCLFEIAADSMCAAVLTRNAFCAAPVEVTRRHLATTEPRYWLINSGNANAGTGEAGRAAALACCAGVAHLTGCSDREVLPFSTGVIGEDLPVERLLAALPTTLSNLSENGWQDAAKAIMTTDTRPKMASVSLKLGGNTVNISGIAKGSGMIHPNMATLLSFVATDAALAEPLLQQALLSATAQSFNRISVDGDTSTNDACVLAATGQSGMAQLEQADDPEFERFQHALTALCIHLAKEMVRDAEGGTKLITVRVEQGATEAECLQVAYTIAQSPLVKTAFFASDPNWGRILAAVGRSEVNDLDVAQIKIYLDEVCIVQEGGRAASYDEAQGQAVMEQSEIQLKVQLGRGKAHTTVWTCDFSYDYVKINAEYRT
ncbi:bifunctional glutamate N-acetyltransferase/amino-acid acetyltransferase ArgJ [Candidatus Venteria ishoeyi]|uniref:Arginine biosynthesis bifunctional protein ArgJ n=1 Tax=Candidatus Venteria ishoeyi TaxID=1899563 RepID=A0A1H6FC05_9GAMM|nr:bifunctional glutamate N-acetyltransferase/amino-acid acetyltransferase ArgJ [Candidatus Venteria ishoeyi]SEH07608.1 Arginine biosynthesis bifunctional protein ArgJ [Candidatus Venteria ishoeyi]